MGYSSARTKGLYESQVAATNAGIARNEANQAIDLGNQERNRYGQKVNMMAGASRASAAAQGIDPNTGSAAAITSETESLGALDKLTIQNNAYKRAFGLNFQATNYDAQSKFADIAGNASGFNTLLTGGLQGIAYGAKAFGGGSSNNSDGWENDDTLNSANADRHYSDGNMIVK